MQMEIATPDSMQAIGARIGHVCRGGEVIELVGDIGAGKTTFTKGLAKALGVDEDVQSPTFTISRVYQTNGDKLLAHYDFYRLHDPGIMRAELMESVNDPQTITVIEWAEIVTDVLPPDTLRIAIHHLAGEGRSLQLMAGGPRSQRIMEQLA